MIKPELCMDYYRESLKIGDFVMPCIDNVIDPSIKGYITKIDYVPENDKHYLTLQDENGNITDKIWYSRCFSTPERIDIRKNKKYVYSLTCFNDEFKSLGKLPLTNTTDINYDIPESTCYITINAEHLEERPRQTKKENILGSSSFIRFFFLVVKDKLEMADVEHRLGPVLISDKVIMPLPIGNDYKLFNNMEELKEYVKCLISYFNEADLTHINNDKEFIKNKIGQEFEDELVLQLKK